MDPWYRVVTLRKEVREGRSFNRDELAIALEQVVSGGAPEDDRDPVQFLARTCFPGALREHTRLGTPTSPGLRGTPGPSTRTWSVPCAISTAR
jgi:hypothetical protein